MHIETLSAVNYRSFIDSQFSFDPSLNLIVGANGSGKSSLLAAIGSGVSEFVQALSGGGSSIVEEDVRFETELTKNRVRFERRYPAILSASGEVFGEKLSWTSRRTNDADGLLTDHVLFGAARKKKEKINLDGPLTLPIVAAYGPHRSAKGGGASLGQSISDKVSRFDGYKSWVNAFADRTQLEMWVVGKTLEYLQLLAEGEATIQGEKDELAIVNEAIAGCIPYATGLRYDLRRRTLMLQFGVGAPNPFVPFASLSDGQQSMISLVADIARRMCILNPQLGGEVLKKTDGVVTIDELDIHLHPAWQRRILTVLRETFPLVQFFATSHSPQMIGGLKPKEVIIMKNGKQESPQITFGLDSSHVLEEVMGVDSREPTIRAVLERMFASVEKGDLEGAKRQLRDIREIAPDLPDYARLESLIRRKETLGR